MNDNNQIIRIYHGGAAEIRIPDVNAGRNDVDFGAAFYTTRDELMAKKWASNRTDSCLNTYELNLEGLRIKELIADEEWFTYVMFNRHGGIHKKPFDDTTYDIITGPTANDKLFIILDMYEDGLVSMENAIRIVNCMHYSDQIAIKNSETIRSHLTFLSSKMLFGQEKDLLVQRFKEDSIKANIRTKELIRELNGR